MSWICPWAVASVSFSPSSGVTSTVRSRPPLRTVIVTVSPGRWARIATISWSGSVIGMFEALPPLR